jgi:hypothetical protein
LPRRELILLMTVSNLRETVKAWLTGLRQIKVHQ